MRQHHGPFLGWELQQNMYYPHKKHHALPTARAHHRDCKSHFDVRCWLFPDTFSNGVLCASSPFTPNKLKSAHHLMSRCVNGPSEANILHRFQAASLKLPLTLKQLLKCKIFVSSLLEIRAR